MLRIEHEGNIEVLRQVALLQDREIQRLIDRNKALVLEVSQLRGEDGTRRLQLELDALKELLARRERALFAASSERRPHEHEADHTSPAQAQRGHGPRPQPRLPLIEKMHELAEGQRSCDVC